MVFGHLGQEVQIIAIQSGISRFYLIAHLILSVTKFHFVIITQHKTHYIHSSVTCKTYLWDISK